MNLIRAKYLQWNAASWRSICIVLCVVLSTEFVRAGFPAIIFNPHLDQSRIAYTFAFVFLAPLLVIFQLYRHKIFPRRPQLKVSDISVFLLIVARGGMLLFPSSKEILIVVGMLAAVLLLNTLMQEKRGFGFLCLLGLAFSAALNAAFSTWEPIWQQTAFSNLVGLGFCVGISVSAWKAQSEPNQPSAQMPMLQVIGWYLFFALHLLIFHNVGFVTALTGGSPLASTIFILLGDALTLLLLTRPLPLQWRMGLGAGLVILLLLVNGLNGFAAAITLIIAQCITGALTISNALPHTPQPIWRFQLSNALGSVLSLALVLAWYLGYQYPLPSWTSGVVQAAAGLALALMFWESSLPIPLSPAKALSPLLFGVIPLVAILVPTASPVGSSGETLRFMTYNVHQGANTNGEIDLESIAQVIEEQGTEIAVLQEVTRGQLITGSVDIAAWLSRRLGMASCFAPAVDFTFGELLLSSLPIQQCGAHVLPKGNAAQIRSYVRAVIVTPDGTPLTVIGTHLDHTSDEARLLQTTQLLADWQQTPHTIIAGDMNATPESSAIQAFEQAGFVSAQDATGNATLATFPSTEPRIRIDWIFGTPDLNFSQFVISPSLASDHLPVTVNVEWLEN